MVEPRTKSKAFQGAYKKGFQARLGGKPRSANPYGDDTQQHGGVTWGRAFWRHWNWGWDDAEYPFIPDIPKDQIPKKERKEK